MPAMKTINVLPGMRQWAAEHLVKPAPARMAKPPSEKPTRTPVTALDQRAIAAIAPGRVTYVPGIGTKRFAGQIQGAMELTDKQRAYLWAVVWKFRRQIKDRVVVREAEKMEADRTVYE